MTPNISHSPTSPRQWCMFGVVVTFSYRAPPSKYALFLAIAEQTVKTLLVHIIYQIISDGVAHRVDTKIGGVDLGPSRFRIGRIAHDGFPSREGRRTWLIGAFSLPSSKDHRETGGSKRSFVDKCNARGGKGASRKCQIRQKEGCKAERGCC